MFFHIFRNTFITTHDIPAEIRSNYKIESIEFSSIDPVIILQQLADLHDNSKTIFYEMDNILFNSVIKQYCLDMGLDSKIYNICMDGYDLYIRAVVKVYEPKFRDTCKRIEDRDFSYTGQHIPWNYGLIPIEYWINHISTKDNYIENKRNTDSYAYHLYTTMHIEYNKIQDRMKYLLGFSGKIHKTLKEFIDDPSTNGAFNSEFDLFYFNKRLMKYLQEVHYVLKGIKSDISLEEIEEYNKSHRWEHVNYDHKSIY